MSALHRDPRIGTDLGPYRIERVLGRGGMGVVYLAEQPSLGRKVALKVIAPEFTEEPRAKARFLRESQMAAAIDHPNILPIHEAGEIDGVLFIAMRYVEGEDLARRLAGEPLSPRSAIAILAQVAAALDAAHARGLIHRDVKPANILLDPHAGPDGSDHTYLTDFGLTKRGGAEGSLTAAGGFAGTLAYIAPEQVEGGQVDGRSDEYSLACVAYECLTGRPPFERETDIALAMAHLRDPVPPANSVRAELPSTVDVVFARSLAKNPAERYESCSAFVADLREALGVTQAEQAPRRTAGLGRRLVAVSIGVAATGVAIGLSAILMTSLDKAAPLSEVDSSISDPFPDALESELVSQVGTYRLRTADGSHELSTLCGRGDFELLPTESAGHPVAPLATLECGLKGAGADRLRIRWLRPSDAYTAESVLRKRAQELGIDIGDCARGAVAMASWSLADKEVGAILCFHDDRSGDAVIVWTISESQLLLEARRSNGNAATLYNWWLGSGRFIGR